MLDLYFGIRQHLTPDMDCTPTDSSEEGRISLAYRDLDEFPSDCLGKIDDVTVLDVSHNKLSYPLK